MCILLAINKQISRLRHARRIFSVSSLILILSAPSITLASWLDSDYWCRVYGCVVASDGVAYNIYDVYDFTAGTSVSTGSQLIAWSNNPYIGVGTVDTVETGTLVQSTQPDATQGQLLGIDEGGDGALDFPVVDANNSGYLDLGDQVMAFTLSSLTDIVAQDGQIRHSFYVASRTDFSLYGRASVAYQSGDLGALITPDLTTFSLSMTRRGVDDGFSFGSATANPRFNLAPGVDSLNAFWGSFTELASFRRAAGTRRNNAAEVASQSVRLDFQYTLPEPDFFYGTGELNYKVEYLFYNR
jgi:hypothetical protein